MARARSFRLAQIALLALTSGAVSFGAGNTAADQTPQLRVVRVSEADGQILSYRHLAGSTEVRMRGTRLAPDARIELKIGSRPGFVELDINHGGITGLKPAHRFGEDFLTYVLWAVSIDGRASNLGEITFEGDRPVPVNLTTPYQTFWLMVTAEPNYAVVDPSAQVVMYSVRGAPSDNRAIAIKGDLFFFTHYTSYGSAPGGAVDARPNQLLQARKAVELASRSGLGSDEGKRRQLKEEEYAHEAFEQAKTFLAQSETAYRKNPRDQTVVQFARTAAQSAENARALAMGAVGDLQVRQLEGELAAARREIARLKAPVEPAVEPAVSMEKTVPLVIERPSESVPLPRAAPPPLVEQPALWFAVAGWAVAGVLLFRRRSF
jgi:hypothetical protein